MVTKSIRKKRTKKSKRDYLDNKTFTDKIIQWKIDYVDAKSRWTGEESQFSFPITNDIAEDFYKIAINLAKTSRFNGYLYKEDMIQLGMLYMCKYAHNFKIDCNNGFAYFSQICWNGFIQTIKKEYAFSEKKKYMKDIYQEDLLKDPNCPMDKCVIAKIKNF